MCADWCDGETAYIRSVRHRHPRGAKAPECRTTLSLRREGTQEGPAITFRESPGRLLSEGYWESGAVASHGAWLNLREPGMARRSLDAAAGGLLPARAGHYGGRRSTGGRCSAR
ncbi:hypothetical protein GCM10010381_10440 [Streptomyces xantholiticus]|nr:hypothetical protein GCM10010381_10440 [Streptomyces xantholiticus]